MCNRKGRKSCSRDDRFKYELVESKKNFWRSGHCDHKEITNLSVKEERNRHSYSKYYRFESLYERKCDSCGHRRDRCGCNDRHDRYDNYDRYGRYGRYGRSNGYDGYAHDSYDGIYRI